MKMTERESAHPGSCEIPAELVTSNSETKNIKNQENCVVKPAPNVGSVKV